METGHGFFPGRPGVQGGMPAEWRERTRRGYNLPTVGPFGVRVVVSALSGMWSPRAQLGAGWAYSLRLLRYPSTGWPFGLPGMREGQSARAGALLELRRTSNHRRPRPWSAERCVYPALARTSSVHGYRPQRLRGDGVEGSTRRHGCHRPASHRTRSFAGRSPASPRPTGHDRSGDRGANPPGRVRRTRCRFPKVAPSVSSYQVTLPMYAGPMDLLLELIEGQQPEITEVSLALVTDQYLAYLAQIAEP